MSESEPNREPRNPPGSENRVPAWTRYADLPEAEVVEMAQRGHEDAGAYLLTRYRTVVQRRVQSYFLQGAERDDLLQLGMTGLWQAIREYRPAKAPSFEAFASACIDRHIRTTLAITPP